MLFSSPFVTVYTLFLAVVIGLCAGSFLYCYAYRLVHHEPIAKGRSHCTSCGHTLGFLDLFPLFSWLFLKGKCRYCGEKIPARYPLSELLTAVVFVSIVLKYDITLRTLELLLLAAILLCITFTDLLDFFIPDRLLAAGIVVRVIFVLLSGDIKNQAIQSIIGGFSISLPLFIVVLIAEKILKKEAMGGGDIKLLFVTGLYFPWQVNLLSILLACFAGIILALVIMRIKEDTPFPFGPAIACGTWLGMLFGSELIALYMGLFA